MKDSGDRPAGEAESGFLARWSQRKADSRRKRPPPEETAQEADAAAADMGAADAAPIDPASLPPIDSLTADSDFSVFLKAGVPPALRVAALRKLWLTEPSVLEPDKLVEYGWDFNAPDYGEIVTQEQIARLRQAMAEGRRKADPAQAAAGREAAQEEEPEAVAGSAGAAIEAADTSGVTGEDIAAEPEILAQGPAPRRRHGGALPR
ncbi:MAG TPA: DUF3306 domain-containing protein [Ferrovibrio sp.]|jgi:hypothetical protein|uniref:DUF3306 domain-containing protein n=1 Tax=Ferrovibrio sp. TaxID=1917215 RepID=UPI002ED1874A